MALTPDVLRTFLWQCPAADQIKTWWLAYSGGVDSQVLLFLLSRLDDLDVRAVYIDHGLQAASADWAQHCAEHCRQLNIPFQSIGVDASAHPGESPEAAARHARYVALARLVGEQDCLLTAQHQDDQAETLLLQLLRGAGAAGLAAMPAVTRFSRGWHVRPLLGFSRQQIETFAREQQLHWVEDPSNRDDRYDRNFLRNHLMPLLKQRWPSVSHSLSRAAELQAENAALLDAIAVDDLDRLQSPQGTLSILSLLNLNEARQGNVLRHWIRQQGFSLPSRAILQQIRRQMRQARDDASPAIRWGGAVMHRYQGRLYVLEDRPHDPHLVLPWNGRQALDLPSLGQRLQLQPAGGQGLAEDVLNQPLSVRFRTGGERLKPAGRRETHALKKLLQDADVPPWQRDRIPLLYSNETLIAVVGYWIAEGYQAPKNNTGLMPVLSARVTEGKTQ